MWYAGTIDILSHYYILSQDWRVLQDVIIICMKDSLYWFTSNMLELPCTISPFYVAGGVSFHLVLHLWYGGMQVVHYDVRVFVLQEMTHAMVE